MKADRLRAGLAFCAALFLCVALVPGVVQADEALLQAALDDYNAGRAEEGLQKLREYVATNPDNEEVYRLMREVEDHVWLNGMAKGGEHEQLWKHLFRKMHPPARARMTDADAIGARVEEAVTADDFDQRHRAAVSLRSAGELAVPALVKYLSSEDLDIAVNAMLALRQLHSDGTMPLAAAMASENARTRMYVAAALGMTGDERARPALTRALEDEDEAVREKAATALAAVGGSPGPAADAYVALAQSFYDNDPVVVRAFDNTMNLWRWEDGALARYEVPAFLYAAQMAEELTGTALQLDAGNRQAAALLVRAILKQRTDADALAAPGAEAPESLGGATDVARLLGYQAASDAVGASLAARDWPVAAAALDLVAATHGDEPLEGSALSAALDAPDQRVRFHAAIAALRISPNMGFAGADKVPALAARAASSGAVRQALVIDDNDATRSKLVMALDGAGFVVGSDKLGTVGANRAKSAPTLDVIVIRANIGQNPDTVPSQRTASALMVIDELLADARTKGMRILVLVDDADQQEFFQTKYGDQIAGFLETPLAETVAVEAVGAAAEAGDLGPDRERANAVAAAAADAFGTMDTGCSVFDLTVAVEPLSGAALEGPTDTIRMNAVKALGNLRVGGADALEQVLSGDDGDELKVAAATSLGQVLSVVDGTESQIEALMNAAGGEGDVANAALKALGQVRNLSADQRLQVYQLHRRNIGEKAGD